MARTFFLLLFLPAAYSVSAQHDTYLLRNLEYGKKVGPAVPLRPRPEYVPSLSNRPGIRTQIAIKYPVLAVRNSIEADVIVNFTVAPDGQVIEVKSEKIDSLVIDRYSLNRNKLGDKSRDASVNALIKEAIRGIYQLRLEPADTTRYFQKRVSFRIR
ncbi:MAG: hypothetical protein H7330_05535 [Hymenobacteraceae bacterium]|nr:hypothetical protein [Hymenobacteraceae bacterium]